MTKEIVQIIPCERGWHCSYYFRDGDGKILTENGNCQAAWSEIACWAQLSTGDVEPMVPGDHGLLLASEWSTGGEYHVYSPAQSWEYALTCHTGTGDIEAPHADWEALRLSENDNTMTILWRGRG
jgi:hypothetical protein